MFRKIAQLAVEGLAGKLNVYNVVYVGNFKDYTFLTLINYIMQ